MGLAFPLMVLIIQIVTCISSIAIIVMITSQRSHDAKSRAFAAMTAPMAGQAFSTVLLRSTYLLTGQSSYELFSLNILLISTTPYLLFNFVTEYFSVWSPARRRIAQFYLLFIAISAICVLNRDAFIYNFYVSHDGFLVYTLRPLAWAILLVGVIGLFAAVYTAVQEYRRTRQPTDKMFVIGIVLGVVSCLSIVLPGVNRLALDRLVYLISSLLVARSVLHYRLFDPLHKLNESLATAHAEQISLNRQLELMTRQLQESEQRLLTTLANAPIVLFCVDNHGIVTLVQGKEMEMLQIPSAQLVGHSLVEVVALRPELNKLLDHYQRALSGESFTELIHLHQQVYETRYMPIQSKDQDGGLGVIGVATDVTDRERAAESAQQIAVINERNRIAEDLHDHVTQNLNAAMLFTEKIPKLLEKNKPEAERLLENLRVLLQGTLAELRNMLLELRPTTLTEVPISRLLQQLVTASKCRTTSMITLIIESREDLILPQSQLALYRITQEALNTVIRHTPATRLSITLTESSGWIILKIENDGAVFHANVEKKDYRELQTMRERAATIGATLELITIPEHGTCITIAAPISPEYN